MERRPAASETPPAASSSKPPSQAVGRIRMWVTPARRALAKLRARRDDYECPTKNQLKERRAAVQKKKFAKADIPPHPQPRGASVVLGRRTGANSAVPRPCSALGSEHHRSRVAPDGVSADRLQDGHRREASRPQPLGGRSVGRRERGVRGQPGTADLRSGVVGAVRPPPPGRARS